MKAVIISTLKEYHAIFIFVFSVGVAGRGGSANPPRQHVQEEQGQQQVSILQNVQGSRCEGDPGKMFRTHGVIQYSQSYIPKPLPSLKFERTPALRVSQRLYSCKSFLLAFQPSTWNNTDFVGFFLFYFFFFKYYT